MATATNIRILDNHRMQFQGLFSNVLLVTFTIPETTVSGNATEESSIAVAGVDHETDYVLAWTHTHDTEHAHEVMEDIHTWDGAVHLIAHNRSGSPVTIPATTYRVIVARLVI